MGWCLKEIESIHNLAFVRYLITCPHLILCYFSLFKKFLWSTLTCGKFTAPLLQKLSPRFTDSMIGMTLALQYAIVAMLAGWGGSLADAQERISPRWGLGRVKVLGFALTLGTIAFLGHGLPEYTYNDYNNFIPNGTAILVWHISMRCIYAVSMGIVAPCMDGLALAHLDCIDGASASDFGIERMYGALFWGVGSLAAGIGIDYFGFDFLYTLLVISTLLSYISMGIYLWGLSKDTTGAFIISRGDESADISADSRYQNEEDVISTEEENEDDIISNADLLRMVYRTGYGRALLIFVFMLAMGIAVVDNLAFIFFDALGASSTMDGWTVVFTVMFEIPVFYVAPKLLEKYGPGKLLLAAGMAYVVRVIGYTLVPEGKMYLVLMLETLHGLTYAGSKAGGVEFIQQIIPEGYEASGQGILIFVTYFGVVAGLICAGWMQETLGARVMYRAMAAIVCVGISVLFLAELTHDKQEHQEKSESNENRLLIKSSSSASAASDFADASTERYMKKLKYDSLNKYAS